MSSKNTEELKRFTVAGIPLINSIIEKLNLRAILSEYVPSYGNEKIPVSDTLLILLLNMTLGRRPLYELESWVQSIGPKCLGLDIEAIKSLNDDRFARAADKLYLADRASLMTAIVINMVDAIKLTLNRVHNDSTTVKAYGKIPGKTRTGLKLAQGKSKDHRPDLKQLVFSLSISADGAVPIHYKIYSGNRTDDTTHIETWNTISKIAGKVDFIYVADCKVCTKKQLSYIVGKGGHVITIMPKTWKETKIFKDGLRTKRKEKKYLWSRKVPYEISKRETFSIFAGDYYTEKEGHRIHWIHSTEKQRTDFLSREGKLKKANRQLLNLIPKLNKRKLKTLEEIEKEVEKILMENNVAKFFEITISEQKEERKVQIGKGRPGPNTKYKTISKTTYSLYWEQNEKILKEEKRIDGIFPLLATDESLSAKDVLKYYKYQPKLEKRFTQFKSIHKAAPLLFKKIERVEAIMFLFFLSLMIQAIIEREVRLKMQEYGIEKLPIYPEFRDAYHPTTSKILDCFDGISFYQLKINGKPAKEFKDSLTVTQEQILIFLSISQDKYWSD